MAHPSEGSKKAEARQENTDKNQLAQILKETQIQLRRHPDNQELLLQLATLQKHQGETTKAVENALKVKPSEKSNPTTLLNLGCLLFELGDADDALARIKLSLKIKPDYAHAYTNLGAMLNAKHNRHSAIRSYLKACRIEANNSSHYHTAGCLYRDEQNLESAKSLAKSAILLAPTDASHWFTLGLIQHAERKVQSALKSYSLSTIYDNNNADAYNNIGVIHQRNNESKMACLSYRKAAEINPINAGINYNLSTALLANGEYAEGWKYFQWRLQNKSTSALHALPNCPLWDGSNLKANEKLGIISEQGLGDTLQFIRYCLALQDQGINYQTFLQKSLIDFIKDSGIDQQCQPNTETHLFEIDKWIPLMSLPAILGVTPKKPLVQQNYLRADSTLTKKWRKTFKDKSALIIGVKWQGFAGNELLLGNTIGRSFPLKILKPLAVNFNIKFVSLQKDEGCEQIETCGFTQSFTSNYDEIQKIKCFKETAAIIKACDIIITCDSVIAHLSGGLGAKTWILLNYSPEWRWGTKGSKTFWYPSATLFRQSSEGNWTEVIQSVSRELEELQNLRILNSSHSL